MIKKISIITFIFSSFLFCDQAEVITFKKEIEHHSFSNESLQLKVVIPKDVEKNIENLIYSILEALQKGRQIYCVEREKKQDDYITFELVFKINDDAFSWRLYDKVLDKYLVGKEYKLSKKLNKFIRPVCKDIWTALFDEPTPFDSLLAYIKKTSNKNGNISEICISSPLIKEDKKKVVLRSTRTIVDLTSFNGAQNPFLMYSEITHHNVRIMKLTEAGIIIPLIDKEGTSAGFITSEDFSQSFYVRSGIIYNYFYDQKNGLIHHIPFISHDLPCSSPAMGNDNELFYAYNGKIYCCKYDPIKHKPLSSEVISIPGLAAYSPSLCTYNQIVVYAQKVGSYMQLVSYDIKSKKSHVITKTNYHKEDPVISPCGNYVAYVVYDHKKNRNRIELLNIYTGSIIQVTEAEEECFCPCWLMRSV